MRHRYLMSHTHTVYLMSNIDTRLYSLHACSKDSSWAPSIRDAGCKAPVNTGACMILLTTPDIWCLSELLEDFLRSVGVSLQGCCQENLVQCIAVVILVIRSLTVMHGRWLAITSRASLFCRWYHHYTTSSRNPSTVLQGQVTECQRRSTCFATQDEVKRCATDLSGRIRPLEHETQMMRISLEEMEPKVRVSVRQAEAYFTAFTSVHCVYMR